MCGRQGRLFAALSSLSVVASVGVGLAVGLAGSALARRAVVLKLRYSWDLGEGLLGTGLLAQVQAVFNLARK